MQNSFSGVIFSDNFSKTKKYYQKTQNISKFLHILHNNIFAVIV